MPSEISDNTIMPSGFGAGRSVPFGLRGHVKCKPGYYFENDLLSPEKQTFPDYGYDLICDLKKDEETKVEHSVLLLGEHWLDKKMIQPSIWSGFCDKKIEQFKSRVRDKEEELKDTKTKYRNDLAQANKDWHSHLKGFILAKDEADPELKTVNGLILAKDEADPELKTG